MNKVRLISLLTVVFALTVIHVSAQSTEFTYQGRLLSGDVPANGAHDFEFLLWDAISAGNQIGLPVTLTNVNVNNGVFSVRIDFGNQFPGANRFLEIKVRQSGTGSPFNPLTPRQAISSAPYAIKSINAENAASAENATNANRLGGVSSGNYVITNDPRMTDARQPLPNSSNYVQNSTTQQAESNFNVSGTGTAGILNATTRFDIGGQRILSNPASGNLFAGINAGANHTTGIKNSLFGRNAGAAINSAAFNAFFGESAGVATADGFSNSFFGASAGESNTSGTGNSFFGFNAGTSNTTGFHNTALGSAADISPTVSSSTAIGHRSFVTQGNSIVLGSINGVNSSTSDTRVGIGTTAPAAKLTVAGRGAFNTSGAARFDLFNSVANAGYLQHVTDAGLWQLATTGGTTRMVVTSTGNVGIGTTSPASTFQVGTNGSNIFMGSAGCGSGVVGIALAPTLGNCSNYSMLGDGTNTFVSRPSGGSLFFSEGNNHQMTIGPGGTVRIGLSANTATSSLGRLNVLTSSNAVTSPVAVLESLGNQIPLAFSSSGTEVARVRADSSGNLVLATVGGSSKDIYLRAGDDSSTPRVFVDGATGNVGIGTTNPLSNLSVIGSVSISNLLTIGNLDGSSSMHLCRSSVDAVAACTSSIRYKKNIVTLTSGLDLIRKLRPVTFNWKTNNGAEIGLIAEEVAKIEPRLTFNNPKGEVEGVNYDSVGVVLVNAVNEQQTEIEEQRERVRKLEAQVDLLTRLLCKQNPSAEVCGPKK